MKKLIVTVGPALLDDALLRRVHRDNHIYRINAAHNDPDTLRSMINAIRHEIPPAEILVDLPGNKIRTANLSEPIKVSKGQAFTFDSNQTNYPGFARLLKAGDQVWADDSTLHFTVSAVRDSQIQLDSHSNGFLRDNKGLHIRGIHGDLPFLFDKDRSIIEVANETGISYAGLSFVRTAEDIMEARTLIDKGIVLISKVETKAAIDNLNSILAVVEHILIDRGDLSTEVGLERVPYYQNYVIDRVLFQNKKVFLATQFLKNMETKPIPTIAEVIDLYNTFKTGVYGIQLSEETAIGEYPVECLDFAEKMMTLINSEDH